MMERDERTEMHAVLKFVQEIKYKNNKKERVLRHVLCNNERRTGLELCDYVIIQSDAVDRRRVNVHAIQLRQLLV